MQVAYIEINLKWNIWRNGISGVHSFYNKLNIRGGDISVRMWCSILETRFLRRTACHCIYTHTHTHKVIAICVLSHYQNVRSFPYYN